MPIYHAVAQRSPEWFALRLGIPCSSEFAKIITPKTTKPSAQSKLLMYRLLAEWMTGAKVEIADDIENFESQAMNRGVELEDSACAAYEMLTDTETQPGGFVTTDDGMIGCSPDRLVGDVGDLELKCPLIQTQVGYALGAGVDEKYMAQIQGRMMITGREWVDIFAFHPRLTIPPIRVQRDEKYIATMRPILVEFVALMLEKRAELERRFGPFLRAEPPDEPPDHSADFVTDADVEMILDAQREKPE